jgi:hypothetical protein
MRRIIDEFNKNQLKFPFSVVGKVGNDVVKEIQRNL